MSPARGAVWATILLLGATVVVSGPAVPAVDLTQESASARIGDGNASFTVVSWRTDSARIEAGRFGAGLSLRVPPAVIDVHSVTGAPTLVYEIEIPGLGFTRTELHFLRGTEAGDRVRLRMDAVTFDPRTVTENAYDAELRIGIREGPDTDVRVRRTVTLTVER